MISVTEERPVTVPIETGYYGAVSVHFPAMCYYCGQGDPDQLLDDEYIKALRQQFAVI